MDNQQSLQDWLLSSGTIKSRFIAEAMGNIDRMIFVPSALRAHSYEDRALPLSEGSTISQPSTVAFMLELLDPEPGQKILDVGAGSGWTTALLAHIVGPTGQVIGVERLPDVLKQGQMNLAKYGFATAEIVLASARLGNAENAPYDRILVSASCEMIAQELMNQLKVGGVMVLPVKEAVVKVIKLPGGKFTQDIHSGFSFVDLK